MPTLYVADMIAIAKEACAAGTIFAPNVTAPGLRMAKPIPTNTAPTQIVGKLVVSPTSAVPAAITSMDAPIVKRLKVFTTNPSINPPTIPITCIMDATVPAVLASPIPFRSIYIAMFVLNVATKIPVIRQSAPKYTILPDIPDFSPFSACGVVSPFGTVRRMMIMIGSAIRNTRYPLFHPAIAVRSPEPFAMIVPPILTKIDWNPITLDLSRPVK